MFLAEIGTAGVISAYFYRHFTSGYSLNVSDYLFVFGSGLVFWLLVLLRATKAFSSVYRRADISGVVKLIIPITILNLCGGLLAPFMKLPLLVRFLLLFQVSSSLALLLSFAVLRAKARYVKDLQQKWLARNLPQNKILLPPKGIGKSHATLQSSRFERAEEGSVAVHNVGGVGGKVDEAGGSGSGHGSGTSGSGENSGGYGGHGRDEGGTGSGHGSGAGGSGENRGGSEGGDRGRDGGGADPECGGRGTNTEQSFKSSKITEMSLMLTAQTTSTLIGFHIMPTPSSSSKVLLVVALMDQLVAYLCGLTSILLSSNKPENSTAAKIFADIGFVCTALGFILMVAMFVPWYFVLIAVLLFGVVWLIFFRNGLKTCATAVWNYLKNARNL